MLSWIWDILAFETYNNSFASFFLDFKNLLCVLTKTTVEVAILLQVLG